MAIVLSRIISCDVPAESGRHSDQRNVRQAVLVFIVCLFYSILDRLAWSNDHPFEVFEI